MAECMNACESVLKLTEVESQSQWCPQCHKSNTYKNETETDSRAREVKVFSEILLSTITYYYYYYYYYYYQSVSVFPVVACIQDINSRTVTRTFIISTQ